MEIAPAPRTGRPDVARRTSGFLLLYGALVGALFLAVLLLVIVWGWSPIAGALVVSGLPLGAVVVRKLAPRAAARVAAATGGVALAGGLVALAFLPDASGRWAAPALFACGLGLGLLGGVLGPASVPPNGSRTSAPRPSRSRRAMPAS